MTDSSRIEDLRRRVQKDPASIAFAQLAEELRRAGQFEESIETCHTGLAIHPGYLSARVTLGRALIELNQLDDAQAELEHVLASASENLAAIRGLAEINHRKNNLEAALGHYRAALALAKNDPDLQETVSSLAKQVEVPPPVAVEGLTLEQITAELFQQHPPPSVDAAAPSSFFDDISPPAPAIASSDFFGVAVSPAPPAAPDIASSDYFAVDAPPVAAPVPEVARPDDGAVDASPAAATMPAAAPFDFFAFDNPAAAAAVPEAAPSDSPTLDTPPAAIADSVLADFFSTPTPAIVVAPPAAEASEPVVELSPAPPELDGPLPMSAPDPLSLSEPISEPLDSHAPRVVAALEQWLEAIHVARGEHGA